MNIIAKAALTTLVIASLVVLPNVPFGDEYKGATLFKGLRTFAESVLIFSSIIFLPVLAGLSVFQKRKNSPNAQSSKHPLLHAFLFILVFILAAFLGFIGGFVVGVIGGMAYEQMSPGTSFTSDYTIFGVGALGGIVGAIIGVAISFHVMHRRNHATVPLNNNKQPGVFRLQ